MSARECFALEAQHRVVAKLKLWLFQSFMTGNSETEDRCALHANVEVIQELLPVGIRRQKNCHATVQD